MRLAPTYLVVGITLATTLLAAERKSWNKVRYVGGTVPIKTTSYDWNTKVTTTFSPDSIEIAIAPVKLFAPHQAIKFKPSQIVSLGQGRAAWRLVQEVPGAQFTAKPPSLFGLMEGHAYLGIVYHTDDGKTAGLLLDSYQGPSILNILKEMSGKTVEDSP